MNLVNAAMNATGIPMGIPMVSPTTQAITSLLVRITTPRTEDSVTMTHIMYMTTTTTASPAVNLQDYAVLLLKHISVTIIVIVANRLSVAVTTTMTTKTAVPLLKRHFTSMANSPRILYLKETSPLVSRSRKALYLMLKWQDSMNGRSS